MDVAEYALVVLGCVVGLLLLVATVTSVWVVHRVPTLHLKGKVVLLTGGSEGIGKSLAKRLAREGAVVVIAARRVPVLKEAVSDIQSFAGPSARVFYVCMDVSDTASIEKGVDAARRLAGGDIDVLMCNAGYSHPTRFLDLPESHMQGMVNVNLFGVINLVKAVLPRMYERGAGRVILTSSMAGTAPVSGFSVYGATKAAVRALGQSLDMESAARGVRVQVINPPDVDTPGYEAENKVKSKECLEICAMSAKMDSETFAAGVIQQMKHYRFQINVGFDANLLALGTSAMDPPTSVLTLLAETFLAGYVRLLATGYVRVWYNIVRRVYQEEDVAAGSRGTFRSSSSSNADGK